MRKREERFEERSKALEKRFDDLKDSLNQRIDDMWRSLRNWIRARVGEVSADDY